jgi:hypothetical protein
VPKNGLICKAGQSLTNFKYAKGVVNKSVVLGEKEKIIIQLALSQNKTHISLPYAVKNKDQETETVVKKPSDVLEEISEESKMLLAHNVSSLEVPMIGNNSSRPSLVRQVLWKTYW